MTSQYKIVCNQCGRYEYCDYAPSQEQYDDWQCTMCGPRKDGVVRPRINLVVCGKCSQTFPLGEDCDNCGPEIKTTTYRWGKIGNLTESNVSENAIDATEKGETILRNRVRQEIEAKEEREKNIEKLLLKQTKLLEKLVRMEKKK